MSTDIHTVAAPVETPGAGRHRDPNDPERPNVGGDLAGLMGSAPMFRRAVAGYDRFEVDTYVRWAEEELATAGRAHEHLLVRHLNTVAALDDARALLDHSSDGRELLGTSQRIGTLLAAAADEADGIRAEAEAERAAAAEAAAQLSAEATRALAEAGDTAARKVAAAAADAAALVADARRVVEEAERTSAGLRTEAERYLAEARLTARLAEQDAVLVGQQAAEQAEEALVRARGEVVRMLGVGRDERRRADEEAAGIRLRLDSAAADRRAALLTEIEALEGRRDALRAELDALARPAGAPAGRSWSLALRRWARSLHTH
ncbi:hypothetical protein DQ244_12445 [Blastococcus sp. TBT05-19]|uniref:hypothetical protein n=1 Tax=Blastococcus sp. TBT05-19 TaxID=2250581 RepID=UPI000DEAF232|nr:hypothetical protein [Blastococcus sp. TBT05-19]RBY90267.1 hypothetical protein DQ244_12445 [Blastococcus sp. TBT05-19]